MARSSTAARAMERALRCRNRHFECIGRFFCRELDDVA
jgi:hypothetical protein